MTKFKVWYVDRYMVDILNIVKEVISGHLKNVKVGTSGGYIIPLLKLMCGIIPDVIVLDYYPNRNPLYQFFIKTIKRLRYSGRLKIIISSAMEIEYYSHLRHSLDGYIRKPYRSLKLVKLIKKHLPKTGKPGRKHSLEFMIFPGGLWGKYEFSEKILSVWQNINYGCRVILYSLAGHKSVAGNSECPV